MPNSNGTIKILPMHNTLLATASSGMSFDIGTNTALIAANLKEIAGRIHATQIVEIRTSQYRYSRYPKEMADLMIKNDMAECIKETDSPSTLPPAFLSGSTFLEIDDKRTPVTLDKESLEAALQHLLDNPTQSARLRVQYGTVILDISTAASLNQDLARNQALVNSIQASMPAPKKSSKSRKSAVPPAPVAAPTVSGIVDKYVTWFDPELAASV